MKITGEYNEHGYAVLFDGEVVYHAGNHKQDSQSYVEPGTDTALPLDTIRDYCKSTCEDMAREQGGRFAGVEYAESEVTQ